MGTTRFKGENNSERLSFSEISDSDMIQLRHKPGTEEDSDKGISKASLCSCPFGVSDTSASTAVKSAVLTDSNPDFNLVSGREVVVCFTTANTASSPSLNFAGSGSIPIYYPNGSAVGSWPADTWMHLKYFYATIGNTSIQRWILLSPLPVDTVALNNMQSVTSNAVAVALSKKVYHANLTSTGKVDNVNTIIEWEIFCIEDDIAICFGTTKETRQTSSLGGVEFVLPSGYHAFRNAHYYFYGNIFLDTDPYDATGAIHNITNGILIYSVRAGTISAGSARCLMIAQKDR